ncbi:MAG TPA: hypothetical protein VML55_20335 [Planctomycetaceae bacterium]|nr:hypothetical protein [Planctomycetaceae bacterium]
MLTLWTPDDDGRPGQALVESAVVLRQDGSHAAADGNAAAGQAPVVLPLAGREGAVAIVLVPEALTGRVARNGVPLPAGAHLAGHADRLEHAGRQFWLAASAGVEHAEFSPGVHGGDDVYCFITKARLRAGDAIVICPGRPGAGCGMISRREAWEMALESSPRFRCGSCGFDPRAAEFTPPAARQRKALADVEALIDRYGG